MRVTPFQVKGARIGIHLIKLTTTATMPTKVTLTTTTALLEKCSEAQPKTTPIYSAFFPVWIHGAFMKMRAQTSQRCFGTCANLRVDFEYGTSGE